MCVYTQYMCRTLFIRELAAYFHADPARFKVTGSTPAPMGGVVVVALWIAPAEDPVLALSAADIADRLTNGNTYPVTGMGGLNATTFPLLSTLEMTEEMRRKPPEERYQVVDPATETPPPDGTPQWLLPVLLVVLLVVLAAVVGGFVGCYCCCREKGDTDDSGNDNSGRSVPGLLFVVWLPAILTALSSSQAPTSSKPTCSAAFNTSGGGLRQ